MTKKTNLTTLIEAHVRPPHDLKRGKGFVLSTDAAPANEAPVPASPAPAHSPPKRVNRGFTIREDVIKLLRHVAFEEDRHLYEVVEEALIAYLKKKHRL